MSSILSAARANAVFAPLGILVSAIATIVIVRSLPAPLYVDYMSIVAMVACITLVAEGGVSVAFMRYLPEAAAAHARETLLRVMFRRRIVSAIAVGAGLVAVGPLWARFSGVDRQVWRTSLFVTVALIIAATLFELLSYYGLLGLFRHAEAGAALHSMTMIKALSVSVAALTGATVRQLAMILLIVTAVEALWFVSRIRHFVAGERDALPRHVLSDTTRYGLTSTFDKITSMAGGSAFLLIVLAPFFSRSTLASFAVAGDVVQKVLVVASLPIGNIVLPYLNQSSATHDTLAAAATRACQTTSLIFIPTLAGLVTIAPHAVPVIFGTRYATAAPLVILLAVPLFAESWVRFVMVPALLAVKKYRSLITLNVLEAIGTILAAVAGAFWSLRAVIIGVGIVKLMYVLGVIVAVTRARLLSGRAAPRGLITAAVVSSCFAYGSTAIIDFGPVANLATVLAVFAISIVITSRWLIRLDSDLAALVRRATGTRLGLAADWFFGPVEEITRA
jgi:O-antigen/teichoic acid export membrane protein